MRKCIIPILCILAMLFSQSAHAERLYSHGTPLALTPKEEQSAFVDETVKISYCLLAANGIAGGMTVEDFDQYLAQTHIYYDEVDVQQAEDGTVVHQYAFLPDLKLLIKGDPIVSAEITMTCPEHPNAHVNVPLLIDMNGYDWQDLQKYLSYYAYHSSEDSMTFDAYHQQWLDEWDIGNCITQKHFATNIPIVTLMQFLLKATAFYAGMPSEQLETINNTFQSTYGTYYPPKSTSDILKGVDGAGWFSLTFYKDAFWVLVIILDEKQLLHIKVGIDFPRCEDLFSSAYTEGVQVGDDTVIYKYPYIQLYVDLNETWMAKQLRGK